MLEESAATKMLSQMDQSMWVLDSCSFILCEVSSLEEFDVVGALSTPSLSVSAGQMPTLGKENMCNNLSRPCLPVNSVSGPILRQG